MLAHGWLVTFYAITVLAVIALFSLPIFRFLDKGEAARVQQLDGLRCLCALFVLFSHAMMMHNFWFNGEWSTKGGVVPARFAYGAVWTFFMLSAYLMSAKYYTDREGWVRFYIKRFFRIAPIAWFATTLYLILTIILGGLSTKYLVGYLVQIYDFGLGGSHANALNSEKAWTINGGVMWTLRWEWLLYFSLPFLLFLRTKIPPYIASITLIIISYYFIGYYNYDNAICIAAFGFGMLTRDLQGVFKLPHSFNLVLIALSLIIIMGTDLDAYIELPAFFFLFFIIVNGEDLFGLLRAKGAVRLGDISYSTYLLHAIFLCALNVLYIKYSIPTIFYMPVLFISIITILLIATLSFTLIERPMMEYGKQLAKRTISDKES